MDGWLQVDGTGGCDAQAGERTGGTGGLPGVVLPDGWNFRCLPGGLDFLMGPMAKPDGCPMGFNYLVQDGIVLMDNV